jgi:heme/copper-type cytochrome/quinol oxidase subunit 2
MNRSQNNVLMLFIGIGILLVSGNSFINLSIVAIESDIQALWAVFAITLTMTGLLVAPVLVIMSFGGLVKQVLHPARKQKQKNAE